MNKEEILKKAIEKAVKNGWLKAKRRTVKEIDVYYDEGLSVGVYYTKLYRCYWNENFYFGSNEAVIFSHDFAKAFWGEEEVKFTRQPVEIHPILIWQYHLQQMVISEDPIKYLEQFIN